MPIEAAPPGDGDDARHVAYGAPRAPPPPVAPPWDAEAEAAAEDEPGVARVPVVVGVVVPIALLLPLVLEPGVRDALGGRAAAAASV